jgi:glycosyltransferase involved in cell wall biosynthesis
MHLLRAIDRQAYQMDFACLAGTAGALAPEATALGSQVHVPPVPLVPTPRGLPRVIRWLTDLLRENRYDVVHSHVFRFSGLVLWLARRRSVPVRLAHLHTTQASVRPSARRRVLHYVLTEMLKRYATTALAVSEPVAEATFGRDWRAQPKCELSYYGFDFAPFAQPPRPGLRAELGIGGDGPVIGHVGSLIPVKNHRFLLQVFQALRAEVPDAHLLLVGGGRLEQALRAEVSQRALDPWVSWAGVRNDVPRIMTAAMDLFVFPSLYEGLGIAAVEAQAAGLRCLLSDRVPQDAAVVPGATQFLSLSQPPATWGRRALAALGQGRIDQQRAVSLAERSHFGLSHCVEQITAFYEEASP